MSKQVSLIENKISELIQKNINLYYEEYYETIFLYGGKS